MGKCIIIAPLYRGEEREWLRREAGDMLICADGGYDAAAAHGLRPDLVVGDFDSMPEDHAQDEQILRLPRLKDDTDMVVCLQEGRRRGYRVFRIGGAWAGASTTPWPTCSAWPTAPCGVRRPGCATHTTA